MPDNSMAVVFAKDQILDNGLPAMQIPVGAVNTIVIHQFTDDTVFVGSNVDGVDDGEMVQLLAYAADMYGVGPSGVQQPCTPHTRLDLLVGEVAVG